MNIEVMYAEENIWLSQKRMAELFDVDWSVVTKHLKNIFTEKELSEDSVCAIFAHTAEDGKTYQTKFYSLEAIIAVGYRVNSELGTQFRQDSGTAYISHKRTNFLGEWGGKFWTFALHPN